MWEHYAGGRERTGLTISRQKLITGLQRFLEAAHKTSKLQKERYGAGKKTYAVSRFL